MRPNFFLDVHIKGGGSKGKYKTFGTIGGIPILAILLNFSLDMPYEATFFRRAPCT